MSVKIIFSLIIFISFSQIAINAHAKTFAWLITTDGKVQKLDVAANTITQNIQLKGNPRISVSLQEIDDAVLADKTGNLLLIVNDYGRIGQWIGVYNLRDLLFRKKLEMESRDPDFVLPKLLSPALSNKFYIAWWDEKKAVNDAGGETYSVFDKITLNKIAEFSTFPIDLYHPVLGSADGGKLYSLNIHKNEIKIYDSVSFNLIETISLANIWDVPVYGKGMEYFTNDKILFSQNVKSLKTDPNDFRYFIYTLPTKTATKKISIKEVGYGIISNDGAKLLVVESGNNRVHIYDSVSGQKIKYLDFASRYSDIRILSMATISPDNAKLYLQGESIQAGVTTLIVVDLKSTYSVIAEIPNVKGSRMIFFEDQ